MLDELNAQLQAARPALRARHLDRQPRHRRRHDGEQLERRAVGAVRQDDRPRARAARRAVGRIASRTSGRSTRRRSRPRCAGDTLEAACYRTVRRRRRRAAATRSSAAFRRCCAASAATTSTSSSIPAKPFNLAKMIVGSEGTLGVVVEAKIDLVPLPKAKAVLAIEFEELLEALGATPLVLRARAVGGRGDGPLHPRPREARARRSTRCGAASCRAIPARCCASSSTPTAPRICRRGSRRSSAISRASGCPLPVAPRDRAGRSGAHLELPRSGARPVDGDEGRRQVAVVRRGHGGRAGEAARLHRAVPRRSSARHGTVAGVYAHASVGCLHVRPVVNLKTAEGVRTFEAIANDVADLVLEFGGALSGEHGDGLVRGPFTEKMFGPVLYEAFRTVKRTFDPARHLQPRQDRRRAAADVEPALRRRLPDAGSGHLLRLLRARRHGRAPSRCAAASAPAARRSTGRCARRTWRRGRRSTRRAAARTRCGWRWPGGSARPASATRTCTTCSISASNAAPARPSARSASTSRASRASFSPATGSGTACRCRTRVIGHVHALSRMGQPRSRRSSNLVAGSGVGRWINEQLLGIDRRRTPPACARDTFARQFARSADPQSRSAIGRQPRPAWCCSTTPSRTTTIPTIGMAAADVLEAAGVGVRLAPHGCCGRPLISQGLLDEARAAAQANADALFDAASRGERIVFLEPSCLSAVREDAPALLRGEAQRKARVVGDACVLFEDYVEQEWQAGPHRAGPAGRAVDRAAARPLSSEGDGAAAVRRARCSSRIPSCDGRRSRRRLLRHGRIVRLREGALRRVARDRRAEAAAGRARDDAGRRARRARHVVPRAGRALHRRRGAAPGAAAAVAARRGTQKLAKHAEPSGLSACFAALRS